MTIAWLSGSSDPARAALAPAEAGLLEAVADGRTIEPGNFPWPVAPGAFRRVGIVRASLRNAVQFWRARWSRRYRPFIARRILALAHGDLVLITSSQGLELLRLAWPLLGDVRGVRVIALGPVAGRLPTGLQPFVIQSGADLVSRLGWRGRVHLHCGRDHLSYAADPRVRAAVAHVIRAGRGCGSPGGSAPSPARTPGSDTEFGLR